MSSYDLPHEFIDKEVRIAYQGDNDLTGKIVRHQIPFYVVLKTRHAEVLIPWTSIFDITHNGKPEDAPLSRQTRQEQQQREAQDVVNWTPENLEWQTCESKSGKPPYERYPFEGEKIEAKPDYDNLRKAIQTVTQADPSKHGLIYKGYFYWLFRDDATIGRRKVQRRG